MAKSKSGGSRAYLRGKLANDVYSIGKDGNGNRMQVVRSLAEQVTNPRTAAQMKGRMIMSTVMQAVSAFAQVIDHSFDGITMGQPSISEFIRSNYALVKADADAHPSDSNNFGLNKYKEKGVKAGKWVLAKGTFNLSSEVCRPFVTTCGMFITGLSAASTFADLKTLLGLNGGDYLTVVGIKSDNTPTFARITVSDTLADATVISAANIAQALVVDNQIGISGAVTLADNIIHFDGANITGIAAGVIASHKFNGSWIHNEAVMLAADAPAFTADVAIATYPVGTEMYLNGGEA